MRTRWSAPLCSALLPAALGLLCAGCENGGNADESTTSDATETSSSDTESDSGEDTSTEVIGWIELGWGDGEYRKLEEGSDFTVVRGGQGSEMLPLPLRGAEFFLPGNPTTWMDETGPLVDVDVDIEGFNDGIGGHFKRVANYRLDWEVLEDGTYLSSFVPILIPDGVNSLDLDGLPGHLHVRVRPHEQPAIEVDLDVVIRVDDVDG